MAGPGCNSQIPGTIFPERLYAKDSSFVISFQSTGVLSAGQYFISSLSSLVSMQGFLQRSHLKILNGEPLLSDCVVISGIGCISAPFALCIGMIGRVLVSSCRDRWQNHRVIWGCPPVTFMPEVQRTRPWSRRNGKKAREYKGDTGLLPLLKVRPPEETGTCNDAGKDDVKHRIRQCL